MRQIRLSTLFMSTLTALLSVMLAVILVVFEYQTQSLLQTESQRVGKEVSSNFRDELSDRMLSLKLRLDQYTWVFSQNDAEEWRGSTLYTTQSMPSSSNGANPTIVFVADGEQRVLFNDSSRRTFSDAFIEQLPTAFEEGSVWGLHTGDSGKGEQVSVLIYRNTLYGRDGKVKYRLYGGLQLDGASGLIDTVSNAIGAKVTGIVMNQQLLIHHAETRYPALDDINFENLPRQQPIHWEDTPTLWLDALRVNGVFNDADLLIDLPPNAITQLSQDVKSTAFLILFITLVVLLTVSLWLKRFILQSVMSTLKTARSAALGQRFSETGSSKNPIVEFQEMESSFYQVIAKLQYESQVRIRAEEEALQQANLAQRQVKKLSLLNERMEEFVFAASHDLKSPLTTISGLSQTAQESVKSEDAEGVDYCLTRIESQSKNLSQRIVDMLALLRAEHIELAWTSIDLQQVVKDVWRDMLDTGKVDVVLETVPQQLPVVTGIPDLIRGILENLISNAVKYRDEGEESSFVRVLVSVENERVNLVVEDNGLGVDEVFKPKLFKMFQRFSNSTASGSGLGLALVKSYIARMDGTVHYESIPNGSRFVLSWVSPAARTSSDLVVSTATDQKIPTLEQPSPHDYLVAKERQT